MSWFVRGIKGALGLGGSQQSQTAEQEPEPAVYPEGVPFDEGDPCSACSNPCSTHKQIPDYLKIDNESPLPGSIKPYRRHVLFQTPGKFWNNWAPNLDEAEGSLAAELSSAAKNAGSDLGYRILVTAVDTQAGADGASPCPWLAAEEALVLPDLVALGPLSASNAREALEEFLMTGQATAGVSIRQLGPWVQANGTTGAGAGLTACVLVCAHKLRDKRCGVAGPMIMEELSAACQGKDLQSKVAVLGCSHVGGHKFAGNVIVYGAIGGHWYGRVKPCHAAAIIDTHIMQGKVIKELWRGRMQE